MLRQGNSIVVKLTGVKSNRSAIGARIVVTTGGSTQTGFVASGSSYLSQSDFRQHFGLGKATQADRIDILWPSGRRESLSNVPANQVIQIGDGIVARFAFKPLAYARGSAARSHLRPSRARKQAV